MKKNNKKFLGMAGSGIVFLDGNVLPLRPSQRVYNHSEGFSWGYGGSGPAQLALAILLEVSDKKTAVENYQAFKWDVIARLRFDEDFELPVETVKEWLKTKL